MTGNRLRNILVVNAIDFPHALCADIRMQQQRHRAFYLANGNAALLRFLYHILISEFAGTVVQKPRHTRLFFIDAKAVGQKDRRFFDAKGMTKAARFQALLQFLFHLFQAHCKTHRYSPSFLMYSSTDDGTI